MGEKLSAFGGMVVVLWVCHLIGDWLLQNDWMAQNKTKDKWVRALHVTLYCIPFCYLLAHTTETMWEWAAWYAWIWLTHFVIDSYKPLMWFRRVTGDPDALDPEKFRAAFGTPRGFFVYVTYDQIFHLLTLLPLAWRLS